MLALMLEELSFRRYGRARDRALLTVWAVLENFGFRQLTVAWWLRGILSFIRGKKSWGRQTRKGFIPADNPAGSISFIPGPATAEGMRPVGISAFGAAPASPAPVTTERTRSAV
jgi:hypothetical protein